MKGKAPERDYGEYRYRKYSPEDNAEFEQDQAPRQYAVTILIKYKPEDYDEVINLVVPQELRKMVKENLDDWHARLSRLSPEKKRALFEEVKKGRAKWRAQQRSR